MRIVITGSAGLIGTALRTAIESRGHEVVRLVRRRPGGGEARWDPGAGIIDAAAFDGADGVIHLAGAGIGDRRWTKAYKAEILESRTAGTGLVATTLASLAAPPPVLVSASAIGYYGDRADEVLTEVSAGGDGFLAEVCEAWEAAADPAVATGIRVVHLRTGIVLDPNGGALGRMLLPFRFGLGGRIGSGEQWWSWIALEDEVDAVIHLLERSALAGPVNLTAPHPVTNAEFVAALGRVLRRPTALPTPTFALKALLGGELAEALLFQSQRVLPARLIADGYEFRFPELEPALRRLLTP